jgi:pimeloyl-ACP methyl ester carboxylesterase
MRLALAMRLVPLVMLALAACTTARMPAISAQPSAVDLGAGLTGERWGEGDYGVVLLGGLQALGDPIGADRMTVVAPAEDTDEALRRAITWLRDTAGVDRAAVVTGSPGAEAALAIGSQSPELVDQLIAVDLAGDRVGAAASLGPFPKLFLAVETDIAAAQELADASPGEWNEAASAADDAELLELILGRLDERR